MNRLTVVVAALGVFVAVAGAQQVVIQQQWAPGDYVMKVQSQALTTLEPTGAEKMVVPQDMAVVLQIGVKELPQGQRSIAMQVKEVRFEMRTPMGPMAYDSTNPNSRNPMAKMQFGPLLDSTVEVIAGPDGQVVEVKGLQEIQGQLPAGGLGAAVAEEVYGKQAIQQMLRPSWMPAGPVSVRQTWPSTQEMTMGQMVGKLELQNTLKELRPTPRGQVAVVESKGVLTGAPDSSQPVEPGMPSQVKFDVEATILYNVGQSMVQEEKVHLAGQMEATGPGQQPTKVTQDVKMIQTVSAGTYQPPTTAPQAASPGGPSATAPAVGADSTDR